MKKGPFDIPNSPSQAVRENPLAFSAVQYTLDLGSNELGHYILFESGFLKYQPHAPIAKKINNKNNKEAEKLPDINNGNSSPKQKFVKVNSS